METVAAALSTLVIRARAITRTYRTHLECLVVHRISVNDRGELVEEITLSSDE